MTTTAEEGRMRRRRASCPPIANSLPTLLRVLSLLLVALTDLQAAAVAADRRDDGPIVRTEAGRVRGKRFHLAFLNRTVDAFLGIPFAQPPVGYLRFRHPRPVERWQHVHDATRPPNACYQAPDLTFGPDFYGSTVWNAPTAVSEDCLYLNVFAPRPRPHRAAVMVWIYGGGFYSGATTLDLYDGKILAALNDVIVVSIGYRLGALGFLSLDHPSAPGNAGLFDQLMGLDWIQKNIRHFGGDPDNVTLFGESAGSVSVSLHLLSPLSHSKFHRAILQSGSANMPWATLTVDEAKRRSTELATEYLSCRRTTDVDALADCLRLIPAEIIVEKQWVSRGFFQMPFLPVVDGVFLTASPTELLRRRIFKRCPLIVGSNRNEGSFFLIYELDDHLGLDKKSMDHRDYADSVRRLFQYYPQYPLKVSDGVTKAIRLKYTDWLNPNDSSSNVYALDMAVGDSQFVCPLNDFALAYSRARLDVYTYYFTQRYSSNPWPTWMGVLHGDEIFFAFGEALKQQHNYTDDERRLSRKIINYWGNFAKTGNPNKHPLLDSLEEWPLHTAKGREYLELNTRFLDQQDKWKAVGRGPRIEECVFWTEDLPQLLNNHTGAANDKKDGEEKDGSVNCGRPTHSTGAGVIFQLLLLTPASLVIYHLFVVGLSTRII